MVADGHRKILHLDASRPSDDSVAVLKALANYTRLHILQLLGPKTRSVTELARLLNMPSQTVAMHVKTLEEAGLIWTELRPASRGLQKVCSRKDDQIVISLPPLEPDECRVITVSMPIGAYVDYEAAPTCGLATEMSIIGILDDPVSFLEPDRVQAQLLWFHHGFVEYRFPYRVPPKSTPQALQIGMEVCSEAPTSNQDWPSDITLCINGKEVGTWTSLSDFGGVRGALTPAWWLDIDSQYGLWKRWEVNSIGTFVDGMQVSNVRLVDLNLAAQPYVTIRIGVKPNARHVGGINLFGRRFGNYPQDLVMSIIL
jgi:predicted transcriptional regulator